MDGGRVRAILERLRKHHTTVLDLAGLVLIVAALWVVATWLGLLTAGAACLAVSWRTSS
jgi:hypothetical protein